MEECKRCYSYAINHHSHGRDGSEPKLCDVCFWRARAELATATLKTIRFTAIDADIRQLADEAIISDKTLPALVISVLCALRVVKESFTTEKHDHTEIQI